MFIAWMNRRSRAAGWCQHGSFPVYANRPVLSSSVF